MLAAPRYRPAMNLRAAAIASALIGLGLVGAWLWPPLAVLTVWPMFLLVPGWALVGWAARGGVRLPSTGRLGLAVILSVAVSAHLVWWLSTLSGIYDRGPVFVAAALLALPIPVAAGRFTGTWHAVPGAGWRGALRAFRRRRWAFVLAGFATAWVGGVLARGLWQVHDGGVDVGGSNWSDLGVHLSIAQSVNAGNFPPQVPFFAGEPLVYHWFADFHAAILADAADLFAIPVFIVHSAVLAGTLALVVHGLATVLLRDRWSGRASWLAAFLAILGGGLGWVRLVGDLATNQGTLWTLLMTHAYDNEWLSGWPYFSIPSVMTTGLLVHRATTAGLPLLAGAVLLVVAGIPRRAQRDAGFQDRPRLVLLGGLAGALLAPFHFFFFPVVPLLVLAWVAIGRRLIERPAIRLAGLFAAPYLLAIPFAAPALGQATGSGWLHPVIGWPTAPLADGPSAVVLFYLTNLGLPFVLALVALVVVRTPARWFLAAWITLLFLVPNSVQVSFVSFDMNKYFQAMWIAVAVAAGALLARWPTLIVAGVILFSAIAPALSSVHHAFSQNVLMSHDQLEAANWIAEHTPQRAVFVTDDWIIAPTDPAGRLRLMNFGPYVANLGFEPDLRIAQIEVIRCGGDPARSAEIMSELGASYVIPSSGIGCEAPVDFGASPLFEEVYANDTVRIYRLMAPT
jgi:hypothetical protein